MTLSSQIQKQMLAVRDEMNISTFVETGTYHGRTARWAATHFPRVVTCEASEELYAEASSSLSREARIEHLLGHSVQILPEILDSLNAPALFWIDSHWSLGNTYGAGDECPLLDELSLILSHPQDHYLFVDDASYFCSPPRPPHDADAWPDLLSLCNLINQSNRYHLYLIHQTFLIFPRSCGKWFAEHLHRS